MKESAAHSNAVLLVLLNCLGFKNMWVKQLFYLGVLEQLLCTCLPYGFVGLWPVAVLNVFIWAEVCCMEVGYHFKDMGADARTALKLILEKLVRRLWYGFIWLRVGNTGGLL
jgi:hypothetical protein